MSIISRFRSRLATRALSELLDQVGSAIESADHQAITRSLSQSAEALGGKATADTLATVLSGRISGEIDHGKASTQLTHLAESLPPTTPLPTLWAMARMAQSVGCFVASGTFSERALDRMAQSREAGERSVSAIVRRDLDAAIDATQAWGNTEALHYLWWWSGGVAGSPHWSTEQPWADSLSGSQVLVLGPAPTSLNSADIPEEALIGRVIAPGVTSWPESDVARGRCDLAWANSKSTKWFVAQGDPLVFDAYRFASFRTDKWRALNLERGRTAAHHKGLLPMPWDKTNMVPLAVWDLLQVRDVDVVVAGTTFFASRTAYTPHDLRFKQERGGSTDQSGSTGLAFERCLSFSHHALVAHLALMANLAEAGAIGFDQEGKAAVGLTSADYLAQLDALYGVAGI